METVLVGGDLGENPSSLGYLQGTAISTRRGDAGLGETGTVGQVADSILLLHLYPTYSFDMARKWPDSRVGTGGIGFLACKVECGLDL